MNHHSFYSIATSTIRNGARSATRTAQVARSRPAGCVLAQQQQQQQQRNISAWSNQTTPSFEKKTGTTRQFSSASISRSAHAPMSVSDLSTRKKITINTLRKLYEKGEPISMVTAHDFPSGLAADQSDVDMVLVGDSLAMVCLGMEDTNQITLDEMIHHCRAVSRGVKSAFIVGDLPMGSYELSPEHALKSSIAMIQKGRASAVKLEGGKEMAETIKKLTSVGIPVLGHIGLTPQRQNALGGFVVQSKTASSASRLLSDALALQDAGVFGMVLEAVPAEIARMVTDALAVPTIGIGAGNGTSGQVLVQVDMLGMFPSGRFMPKFVKPYENLFEKSVAAMKAYTAEVKSREYPVKGEHTYPVKEVVVKDFEKVLEERKGEIDASRTKRKEEVS